MKLSCHDLFWFDSNLDVATIIISDITWENISLRGFLLLGVIEKLLRLTVDGLTPGRISFKRATLEQYCTNLYKKETKWSNY